MRIIHATDYKDMSRKAANIIAAQIMLKPDSVLGLATGSTPIGTYQELVTKHQQGDLDFSMVKSVNLDEYKDLSSDNAQSYHYFMKEHLFDLVNINQDNTYLPNGLADNSEEECKRYDDTIASLGGVDLQLLGLGLNGHIGFNEPTDHFEKGTHCVALSQSTIDANSRLFKEGETVPSHAYTMGIQTIMSARKILLAVNGKAKANIIKEALFGPITPAIPASILQLHPDLIVVVDKEASSVF